jgi:hypothetical protein
MQNAVYSLIVSSNNFRMARLRAGDFNFGDERDDS